MRGGVNEKPLSRPDQSNARVRGADVARVEVACQFVAILVDEFPWSRNERAAHFACRKRFHTFSQANFNRCGRDAFQPLTIQCRERDLALRCANAWRIEAFM